MYQRIKHRTSDERGDAYVAIPAVIVLIVVGLIAGAIYWFNSRASSETNETCVVYSGGPFDAKKYQEILPPGTTNKSIGWGSTTYCYRNDQRSFIGSADPGADTTPVPVVGKGDGSEDAAGNLPVTLDFNLYFSLNTNPKVLQAFHEEIGRKTSAWGEEGWNEMLRDYFKPQVVRAMQNAAGKYSYIDLYSDPATRSAYQADVVKLFKKSLTDVLGGDYFCKPGYTGSGECGDITFTVGNPQLPEAIQKSIEGEIQARRDTAKQAEENRKTEVALKAEQQLVDLYGPQGALIYRALESGKITFWVLPDGTTVPAPQGPAS